MVSAKEKQKISNDVLNNIKKKQSKPNFYKEIFKTINTWYDIIAYIYHQIDVEQSIISITALQNSVSSSHYTIHHALKSLERYQYLKGDTNLRGVYEIINFPEWENLMDKIIKEKNKKN